MSKRKNQEPKRYRDSDLGHAARGNRGHIKRECWRFRGWCYVCGSSEHKVANCEVRMGGRSRRVQERQYNEEQTRNSSRDFGMEERKCTVCNETGHSSESCSLRVEWEAFLEEKKRALAGNEAAPPLPGMCRSQ
ncbi:hypothetical protein Avbf_11406 [Armadillidium vulgare]|nr:hypothetical protein Avbf_11406 [Armadillidium vulgare]